MLTFLPFSVIIDTNTEILRIRQEVPRQSTLLCIFLDLLVCYNYLLLCFNFMRICYLSRAYKLSVP
jgi:hypothetical protein